MGWRGRGRWLRQLSGWSAGSFALEVPAFLCLALRSRHAQVCGGTNAYNYLKYCLTRLSVIWLQSPNHMRLVANFRHDLIDIYWEVMLGC